MRKFSSLFPFLVVFISCSLFLAVSVQASSIKDRMAARLPAINSLKDQGVVGENNQGFLEFRSGNSSQQLIADENKDRAAVYIAIAQKQGATAALVGQRRAIMIAEKGAPGHWFQKADGSWYKK